MSAKRIEYHPLMGALNQTKSPPMRRAFVSAKRIEYHPLYGGSETNKKPSNEEGPCEREEGRTLNQWLKRPLLCH